MPFEVVWDTDKRPGLKKLQSIVNWKYFGNYWYEFLFSKIKLLCHFLLLSVKKTKFKIQPNIRKGTELVFRLFQNVTLDSKSSNYFL